MIEISIIIPTLNRADTLKFTLDSILKQHNLSNVEVHVADNGSSDNTAEACKIYIDKKALPVYYYYDDEPGLLTGRHLAASKANGNILCFIDDDVELSSTWLDGVRNAFADEEVLLATGPCIPKYEIEPPEWLPYFFTNNANGDKHCHWLSLIDLGNQIKTIHPTAIWGLNFCIRKDAFFSLGGFHPDTVPSHLQLFQGDGETGLTLKAAQRNYKSIYYPQIKLEHIISKDRLTKEYFLKRAYFQGICNSYTALRGEHLKSKKDSHAYTFIKSIYSKLKTAISKDEVLPGEIGEFKAKLLQEEQKGYAYHQQQFSSNKTVRDWVLKENYFNYKLPV